MKYFLISWEVQGNPVPRIVNWKERVDYHAIQTGNLEKLPRRTLLYIENNPDTVFSDIIMSPFFLVSDRVWDVIKMYGLGRKGRQMVLLDGVYGFAEIYYVLQLTECECIHADTQFNNDGSVIRKLVLNKEKSDGYPPFFRVAGLQKDYVIGRLDFVESILRRGAKGIKLVELELRG